MPYLDVLPPSAFQATLDRLRRKPSNKVLFVSLGEQKLRLAKASDATLRTLRDYRCSSGKRPPSCVENSFGTPLGLHEVADKIGADARPGEVFVARQSTGQTYRERDDFGPDQAMLVTTRILRLRGLEPGLNAGPGVDSYERYIYIHGTTKPERFPENLSGGCLTLLDADLVELFDAVDAGSLVWIQEAALEA